MLIFYLVRWAYRFVKYGDNGGISSLAMDMMKFMKLSAHSYKIETLLEN